MLPVPANLGQELMSEQIVGELLLRKEELHPVVASDGDHHF